jgi:hypothetical protein
VYFGKVRPAPATTVIPGTMERSRGAADDITANGTTTILVGSKVPRARKQASTVVCTADLRGRRKGKC